MEVWRNRFGYYFFLVMSILCGLLMTIGVIGDICSGVTVNWMDVLLIYSIGVGASVSLALMIRRWVFPGHH